MGDDRGHRMVCSVCGFGSFVFDHTYNPAYFNGERCSVCGYPGQGTTVPQPKPSETTPVETGPVETKPSESAPAETGPAEIEPEETMPQKAAKEDLQRSGSVWIWVATILVAGGLGTVVFFVKKKSS